MKIFGCRHRNLSRIWTMPVFNRLSKPTGRKISYTVCLDCGKQIPYDMAEGIGREITTEERFKYLERESHPVNLETWEPEVID